MTENDLLMQGRLPWRSRDEVDDQAGAFWDHTVARIAAGRRDNLLMDDNGRFNGPYNPLLFHPAIGEAIGAMGEALRVQTRLPRVVFESIILVVAVTRRFSFEWYAHAPVAAAEGVPEDVIEAVRRGGVTELLPFIGESVFDLVRAALDHRSPSDETYAAVETEYGVAGIQEIIHIVTHYDAIGITIATFRVPLPAGVPEPF